MTGPGSSTVDRPDGARADRASWWARRRGLRDLGRWPFRVGICAGAAVLVGLVALAQRDALTPPRWGVVVLVAIAVLPWLVDLLLASPPPWAFAAAVAVPVALLQEPGEPDALPLLLAILALDLGLQAGPLRSLLALLPAVAAVTGPELIAVGPTRWLAAIVVAVAGAWLVGLVLHTQQRHITQLRSRLRRLEAELDERR